MVLGRLWGQLLEKRLPIVISPGSPEEGHPSGHLLSTGFSDQDRKAHYEAEAMSEAEWSNT
jgi:hypothetical protein